MDTKKWEQLVTLYLNEGNEEKARALFHDIIVEKSREIYESMLDMEEGAPVTDLVSEISMEEEGMNEDDMDAEDSADIDMDAMDDMDDMEDEGDMDDMGDVDDADMEDMEEPAEEEDLEDRVVDIEDKLDQLMSEFEELMNKEEGEEDAADDEMDAADDEEDASDDEMDAAADEEDAAADEEESDEMMESVSLHRYKEPKGGDSGSQTRSPALHRPLVDERGVPRIGGGSAEGRKAPAVRSGGEKYGNSMGGAKRLHTVSKPSSGEQPRGKSPVARVTESRASKTAVKPTAKRK